MLEAQLESGQKEYKYQLFYPIDSSDEMVSPPFGKAVIFRKPNLPNLKASDREMDQVRAAMGAQ